MRREPDSLGALLHHLGTRSSCLVPLRTGDPKKEKKRAGSRDRSVLIGGCRVAVKQKKSSNKSFEHLSFGSTTEGKEIAF